MNAILPDQRCPECGLPVDDRISPERVKLLHWMRLVPLTITLLAVIAVVVGWWVGTQKLYSGSGSGYPRLFMPALDYDALQSIAQRGSPVDIDLVAMVKGVGSMTNSLPGEHRLAVGFMRSGGVLSQTRSMGWPTTLWTSSRQASYDNAATQNGFKPAATDPTLKPLGFNQSPRNPLAIPPRSLWQWQRGWLAYQPAPEQTGGALETTRLNIMALLASAGVVVLAWWIVAAACLLLSCIARFKSVRGSRRTRWIAIIVAICFVVAANALSIRSNQSVQVRPAFSSQRVPGVMQQLNTVAGFTLTEITSDTLAQLGDAPDGDQTLAAMIMLAIQADRRTSIEGYFAARFRPASATFGPAWLNHNLPLLQYYEPAYQSFSPDTPGAAMSFPPGWSVLYNQPYLTVRLSPASPDKVTRQWVINLEWLGTVLVGLALIWLFTLILCRFVYRHSRARRQRRGQCIGCGYVIDHELATS